MSEWGIASTQATVFTFSLLSLLRLKRKFSFSNFRENFAQIIFQIFVVKANEKLPKLKLILIDANIEDFRK
jgi:hypothetical protein